MPRARCSCQFDTDLVIQHHIAYNKEAPYGWHRHHHRIQEQAKKGVVRTVKPDPYLCRKSNIAVRGHLGY